MLSANELYHMFDERYLTNDIWYFKNTISYPEELINFIEELDKDERSYCRIPSWSNNKEKIIKFDNFKNSTSDKILDYRTLYIYNSLKMARNLSFDRYIFAHKLRKDDYILDSSRVSIKTWTKESDKYLNDEDVEFFIFTYLNDNYDGATISFKENISPIKPEAGSTLIIPKKYMNIINIDDITSGVKYSYLDFVYNNSKKTDCMIG